MTSLSFYTKPMYGEWFKPRHIEEGSDKELRQLHYVCSQHLQALKATKCDLSTTFITWLIEMKLDQLTMFEWQRDSQDQPDVHHHIHILDLIDL